jgi:signal transduction histidine kinase
MILKWPISVVFTVALALLLVQGNAQEHLIDSLKQIPEDSRDTVWLDQALKASYGVVYNDPPLSEKFLRIIHRTAEKQAFDSRKSRIRLNQGIAKDVMNQPDSAIYFYDLGLAIAGERKDTAMMASAYNNIGLIHWNSDRLDSALFFYRISEDLFEAVGNQRGLLSTMNNMGLIYQSLERREESINYFRKVIEKANKLEIPYFYAAGHQNIATTYSFRGNPDSAYIHLMKAIPIQREIDDLWGLAKSYHTMGATLMDTDSLEEAETYLKKAIKVNLELNNSHALASNYYTLADIYRQRKDWSNRLSTLKKSFDLRDEYDDVELYDKSTGSYYLMLVRDWNKEIGSELRKAFIGKDSLYRARLQGKVLALQEEYEAEKREQELRIKDLEIAEQEQATLQRERMIWGLIVLVVILILFGILFARYRNKLNRLKTQQRLASERSRISRDLHDNIGAQLTAMSTRIDLLDDKRNQPGELAQIRDEAADTVSMLRDTIWAMHREEFTVPQFVSRIRLYANRVLPPSIKLDLSSDKKLDKEHLNSSEALNLFRIAQEAIQNCLKHAEATNISIRLQRKSDRYEFLISDNGKGCILSDEAADDSYGLQNIRERSAEIKGKAEFESDTGSGFTIRVAF